MMDEFRVDRNLLYKTWLSFLSRVAEKDSPVEAIVALRGKGSKESRAMNYFAFLGINMFSEMFLEGRSHDRVV